MMARMLEKKPNTSRGPGAPTLLPKINVMSPRNEAGGSGVPSTPASGKPGSLGQRLGRAILEKAKKL